MISLYKTTLGYIIPVSIVIGLFFIFIISPIFAKDDLTTKDLVNKTIALENETTGIGEGLDNLIDGNNNTASITNLSKSTTPNITNYSTYEDKDIGFQIQYPSDWKLYFENPEYRAIASFKPIDADIYVDVRIFPQDEEYKTIKDFGDKEFKENDEYTLLAYYRNSTTTLGGQPAFKAIYLTTSIPTMFEKSFLGYKSSTSKALMTATLVEPKKSFFAIVYFAPPKIFSHYLPTIEQMIKSFQIDQSGPIIQEED